MLHVHQQWAIGLAHLIIHPPVTTEAWIIKVYIDGEWYVDVMGPTLYWALDELNWV